MEMLITLIWSLCIACVYLNYYTVQILNIMSIKNKKKPGTGGSHLLS
jgi:hypothetical protein